MLRKGSQESIFSESEGGKIVFFLSMHNFAVSGIVLSTYCYNNPMNSAYSKFQLLS